MSSELTREEAWQLLKEYNKEHFHLQHAVTVEGVMRYFAEKLGYGSEADFWGIVGLLHDLDFEMYPDEHCIKQQEIMRERGIDEKIIHATASHGYALTVDIKPEHEMEKVLYAVDELTGLIGAAALSDLAYVLERAADEGNSDELNGKHGRFIAEYKAVAEAIAQVISSGTEHSDEDEIMEFPLGFDVYMYDKQQKKTELHADYGKSYGKTGLIEAQGNVIVKNFGSDETMYSDKLFWYQNLKMLYTRSHVKIVTPDKQIEADSLVAKEDFSEYTMYSGSALLDIDEEE